MSDAALHRLVQDRFWHHIEKLIYLHSTSWELDETLCEAGFLMGPCEAQDLLGLEKVLARAPERPTPVLRRMVAEGRLGKIGGVGFYRYPGGGGAVIDPLIEDLIREEAWFAKADRQELSEQALVSDIRGHLSTLRADLSGRGVAGADADHLLAAALQIEPGTDLLT